MRFINFIFIIFPLTINVSAQNYSNVEKEKLFAKALKQGRRTIPLFNFDDILDKLFYSKTDLLKLTVKNIHSSKNQIPYDYTYLDLCTPKKLKHPREGITELLTGKRMSYSNYYIFMNQNETCAWSCTKNFTEQDIEKYKWLIDRKYHITYYLDKLPSGFLTQRKFKYSRRDYVKRTYTNYFSGIPIGYRLGNHYYIYNHLVFYVKINEKNNKYQIVDFYISAHSAKQDNENICMRFEEGKEFQEEKENVTLTGEPLSHVVEEKQEEIGNNTIMENISDDNIEELKNISKKNNENNYEKYKNRIFNVLEDGTRRYYQSAEEQKLEVGNIAFTYDVIFIQSNKSFSSRYDHYFSLRGSFRWSGLLISNILIFILTFGIFMILRRNIKKDLDKYNTSSVVNDSIIIDEFGWKQIAGDVFRAPRHQKTLSAFIGTGFEVLCLIIVSLVLGLIGFIKPEIRLQLINYILICCIMFSIISGYVSTFIYKNLGGKEWLKNCVITAFFFPTISLTVLGIIRLLMTFEKSSASFKISQMALLCFLWLFISSPLVLAGTLLCLMRNNIKYPCKVNALPTAIGYKPWYLHLKYFSWFTGFIPFSTFFVEFVFLMRSLWTYQVYFFASFLSLSLIFSIIITSEMSIIYVFINLCYGDHKWWWKSFFVSSSPSLYVLMYSFLYFFKLGMTRLSAIVIYFLINILISVVVALVLGACGTLLTFWFVYYIYSKIKID
jgi:transmembrane 9 superfamily protein 2/4